MKKIIIECSQKHTYRKVVEVDEEQYEILMALETLDDVPNYMMAYDVIDDLIDKTNDLEEIELEYTDVVVVDAREDK